MQNGDSTDNTSDTYTTHHVEMYLNCGINSTTKVLITSRFLLTCRFASPEKVNRIQEAFAFLRHLIFLVKRVLITTEYPS